MDGNKSKIQHLELMEQDNKIAIPGLLHLKEKV